jgi:hypothetical protein
MKLPLPTYLQTYVLHTYVLNSDEGLRERALDTRGGE